MFTSTNIIIVVLFLAPNLYSSGNGEPSPRDIQFGSRSLSASDQRKANTLTINHPPAEEGEEETTIHPSGVKGDSENSSGPLNSTTSNDTNATTSTTPLPETTTVRPIDLVTVPPVPNITKTGGLASGWGWDSEMARVAQVMVGMGLYLIAMFVKGVLISWGIGEVRRQLADKISNEGGMDAVLDMVQFAIAQVAQKYAK